MYEEGNEYNKLFSCIDGELDLLINGIAPYYTHEFWIFKWFESYKKYIPKSIAFFSEILEDTLECCVPMKVSHNCSMAKECRNAWKQYAEQF